MYPVFDSPSKPKQRKRDKHRSNIRERKSELRFWIAIILFAEMVVNSVDFRNDEPDSDEEAETWSKVHESYLRSIEAIERTVDGLEVCVQGIGGSEENSLVNGHSEDNGLGEENLERAGHAIDEPRAEGPVILVGSAVFSSVGRGGLDVGLFAGFEDRRGVGFSEEEEANDGVEGADNSKDPEDPAPVEVLDYQAAEKGPECGAQKGA